MGALTPVIGTFLALGWIATLSIPLGWHADVDEMQLIHTYIGILGFKLQKSGLGTGVQLVANTGGYVNPHLQKAGKKLNEFLDEESHWIWEAKDKYCSQDYMGQVAQELIPLLKNQCNMWSRICIASYVVFACTVIGSSLLCIGAFLSTNKSSLSKSRNAVRKVGLVFGPLHGLLGSCIYFAMTIDFPGDGRNTLTFGRAFWASFAVGLLSFLPLVVTQRCEPDKEPDFSKAKQGSEQEMLMQDQKGADYMAVGMAQQYGGMNQQQPNQGNLQFPNSAPQVQFPNSAPGRLNPQAQSPNMETPRPQMPLSWGVVQYMPGLASAGPGKSQPDFRPDPTQGQQSQGGNSGVTVEDHWIYEGQQPQGSNQQWHSDPSGQKLGGVQHWAFEAQPTMAITKKRGGNHDRSQWDSFCVAGNQRAEQFGIGNQNFGIGTPENRAIPQESWEVIARAVGQNQNWTPPSVNAQQGMQQGDFGIGR